MFDHLRFFYETKTFCFGKPAVDVYSIGTEMIGKGKGDFFFSMCSFSRFWLLIVITEFKNANNLLFATPCYFNGHSISDTEKQIHTFSWQRHLVFLIIHIHWTSFKNVLTLEAYMSPCIQMFWEQFGKGIGNCNILVWEGEFEETIWKTISKRHK